MQVQQEPDLQSAPVELGWPILICLFGSFRLLKERRPVAMRSGGKAEALLASLAFRHEAGMPREALLDALWPDSDADLAGQSLNSLVYGLHRLLGDVIDDAPPVLHEHGSYRLNTPAGLAVDLACFERLAQDGEQQARAGDRAGAAALNRRAVDLYCGDLVGTDLQALVERERLRASYLNLLAQLADHHFGAADYAGCLEYAARILLYDPCREDAHRLLMRCHVRRGERAQAFRQFRLCREILRAEFEAEPEPATLRLFEQVRLEPDGI